MEGKKYSPNEDRTRSLPEAMFVASCRYTLIKKTATAFARRSCGEKLQEGEARENKVVSGKEKKNATKCHTENLLKTFLQLHFVQHCYSL